MQHACISPNIVPRGHLELLSFEDVKVHPTSSLALGTETTTLRAPYI